MSFDPDHDSSVLTHSLTLSLTFTRSTFWGLRVESVTPLLSAECSTLLVRGEPSE